MARNRKQRRQQHGSAWHWKQTDCWYYTEPGTRKRVPLFDEQGERVRGKENKEAARLALARVKLVDELSPQPTTSSGEWTVAKVCEIYLADLHQSATLEWAKLVEKWLISMPLSFFNFLRCSALASVMRWECHSLMNSRLGKFSQT